MVISRVESEDCLGCCFHNKCRECCELKKGCFYIHTKDFFYCSSNGASYKYVLKDLDDKRYIPSEDSIAFRKVDNCEHSCDGCVFCRSFCGCVLKHYGYGWVGDGSDALVCGDSYKFEAVDLSKEVVE